MRFLWKLGGGFGGQEEGLPLQSMDGLIETSFHAQEA